MRSALYGQTCSKVVVEWGLKTFVRKRENEARPLTLHPGPIIANNSPEPPDPVGCIAETHHAFSSCHRLRSGLRQAVTEPICTAIAVMFEENSSKYQQPTRFPRGEPQQLVWTERVSSDPRKTTAAPWATEIVRQYQGTCGETVVDTGFLDRRKDTSVKEGPKCSNAAVVNAKTWLPASKLFSSFREARTPFPMFHGRSDFLVSLSL